MSSTINYNEEEYSELTGYTGGLIKPFLWRSARSADVEALSAFKALMTDRTARWEVYPYYVPYINASTGWDGRADLIGLIIKHHKAGLSGTTLDAAGSDNESSVEEMTSVLQPLISQEDSAIGRSPFAPKGPDATANLAREIIATARKAGADAAAARQQRSATTCTATSAGTIVPPTITVTDPTGDDDDPTPEGNL